MNQPFRGQFAYFLSIFKKLGYKIGKNEQYKFQIIGCKRERLWIVTKTVCPEIDKCLSMWGVQERGNRKTPMRIGKISWRFLLFVGKCLLRENSLRHCSPKVSRIPNSFISRKKAL